MTLLVLSVSVGVILVLDTLILPALGQKQLDAYFGRSCRGMALTDFTYLLSLVSDTLSEFKGVSITQLICLVHLSALLLREHPSRRNPMVIIFTSSTDSLCSLDTLVHIQKFATRSINGFAGHDIFVRGPLQLRLRVLDLQAQHCSDQVSTPKKTKGIVFMNLSTASRVTLDGCSWDLVIHI